MTGVVITSLPTASTLTGAEYVPVVQSGTTVKTPVNSWSYTPAGTGAVTTTVQSKLRETVSALDFMTDAQRSNVINNVGSIDVSGAIQNAIDTGKDVFFPDGTYLISTAVQLSTTHQHIYGSGSKSILLTKTDIETFYTSISVFGVVISDLFFENTVTEASGGPTNFHIHFGADASGCIIRQCDFHTALTGSVVRTTHHAGVWFEGANLNNILDCTFGQAQILMGSTDSTIRGGFVYSFSFEYAIKIVSAGEVLIEGVRGILGGPSKGCIWMPTAGYLNKIVNNYFGGTFDYMNIGNGITGVQQQGLFIGGNTFHEIDKIGINLSDCAGGTSIVGNTFFAGDPKQNDPTFLIPGYQDILIESNTYTSAYVTISNNNFNRYNGPVEVTQPGIGKSYAIEFSGAYTAVSNVVSDNTFADSNRYYSPAIEGISLANTKIGNVGVETNEKNQINGDLFLGSSGKFVNVSKADEITPGGSINLSINSAAGFVGILSVGNVGTIVSGYSTKTVYAVSSTGTALVLTSLATQNGTSAGRSFTVVQSTAGILTITDTSGSLLPLQMTACFSGMATYAG